jgi:osmotically-inducible protein OsmY
MAAPYVGPKLKETNLLKLMRCSLFLWSALPIALTVGCVYSHRDLAYTSAPGTAVVTTTSPRPAVRVYPDNTTARVGSVPGEVDDMTIANSIRGFLARDTAHVYGNVDISVTRGHAVLRGTVPTDVDRQTLYNQVAAVPGVVSVEDQLGVNPRY